jgi:hypothetical protein
MLPAVVAALRAAPGGARVPILMDGGVRRGTDVVKALALGADAVLLGRPVLYALALGGQAGVERALEVLQKELELAMALAGCTRVDELGPGMLLQVAPGLVPVAGAAGGPPACAAAVGVGGGGGAGRGGSRRDAAEDGVKSDLRAS